MDKQYVQYLCITEKKRPHLKELVKELSQRGIELTDLAPDNLAAPTLILFDSPSRKLYHQLKVLQGRGLAVSLAQGAMADHQTWKLLNAGAADVYMWSNPSELAEIIEGRLNRWLAIDALVDSPLVKENLVGVSSNWIAVLQLVVEVARFTESTILLSGESGTGKELVARLIHTLDQRLDKRDLVVLDCSTIVPELSGSEFFGHEKGAFTSAIATRDGAFSQADEGTLFLDEIGELTLPMQAALLRVVQEKSYKRVGGNQWKKTNFRLVCATNKDLLESQRKGSFRKDFYYRIAAFHCRLPSLNERREDILPLAYHFWRQLRPNKPLPEFDPTVKAYLLTRHYPGNIRQLRQLIQRMSLRYSGSGPVSAGLILERDRPFVPFNPSGWKDAAFERTVRLALAMGVGLKEIGRRAEETAERIAITDESGNLQRASQKLGITDRALQMRQAKRRKPQ